MGISELTSHITASIGGMNESLKTALARAGQHHSILLPQSKARLGMARECSTPVDPEAVEAATNHFHRST
jgi:hypothetical protein